MMRRWWSKRGSLFWASALRLASQERVGLVLLSIAIGSLCMLQAGPVAAAPRHKILDRPVEYFETGLAVPYNSDAFWTDSHQFLITALARGVTEESQGIPPSPTRVVLVDSALKRCKEIATDAAIVGFDQETLEAVIGERDHKMGARQIRITPAGDVIEVKRVPPGGRLPPSFAEFPRDQLVHLLPHKSDGYLLAADKTKGVAHVRTGAPVPTTWVRPGKPDLPLPIRFEETGPDIIYVDFLGKYLLNSLDSQTSSNTNAQMNDPSRWQRPYTLTPFRLLSEDGKIEEIPYPQFVFDYNIGEFSEFRLTRAGIVISQITSIGGAIYLFQSGQLWRLTRKGGGVWFSRSLPMSGVTELVVSPDGCSVAYSHYNVSPNQVTGTTPRYLSVVKVCSNPNTTS